MNDTRLTKDALYVPSIVFESGTLSSSSEGKVTWNGEELGGSTLNASGDITFSGLDTFTQYVTFNGGMICNSDIVLNGARLLLANGAAVEIYQGTDIPLPEGGGTGSITPGTGNSGESIDTSNFAKLNEDNTFTGNNNFTGNLALDGKLLLNGKEIDSVVSGHNVGEQWISMDGIIPMGGLPFLGQSVSRETYSDLFEWIKNNNRFKTEEEWQSLYTSNNGNVSFYAYDGQIGKKAHVDFSDDYYSHLYEGTYFYSYEIEEEEYIFDKDVTLEDIKEYANHISENSNFDVEIIYLENETYAFKFIAKEVGSQFNDIAITHNNISGGLGEGAHVYKYTTEGEDEVLSDTFRLPSFKGYLKANTTAGEYIKEGLPNITGQMRMSGIANASYGTGISHTSGAIVGCSGTDISLTATPSGIYAISGFDLNASKSNSIYGNSSHVTPETNTILVGVYAFNTIINPSNLDAERLRHDILSNTENLRQNILSNAESLRHDITSNAENLSRDISSKKGYIDYTSGVIAHGTSNSLVSNPDPFTAPYDCYVVYNLRWQGGVEASPQIAIFVDDIEVTFYTYIGSTQITISGGLFLKKGQVLRINASYVSTYYKYIKIIYYPWN